MPGAHRAVKAPKSQGPKGPGSDYSCFLYPLPSSLSHGCWPAALPADCGWRKDGGSGGSTRLTGRTSDKEPAAQA